jgi:hypothetical protein
MVARELHSGREIRLWRDDLLRLKEPPFEIGASTLIVTFAAWAEFSCFQILGWSQPYNTMDLHAEHRAATNGLILPGKQRRNNLLTVARMRGLHPMDTTRKQHMQEMCATRFEFTAAEIEEILNYCAEDVRLTEALFRRMQMTTDFPAALWRGRFGWAVAASQACGVPIDAELWQRLVTQWEAIKLAMIGELDTFGIYVGGSFNERRFGELVAAKGIAWPRHGSGRPVLEDRTFKDMALAYPRLFGHLRELRALLGKMRLVGLTVDADERRNRFLLSPFKSRTGRNQPSNVEGVFGPSVWLRSLVTPAPGTVLIYVDWSSQEYLIAAALSGDERMLADYAPYDPKGDPYIRFGEHGRLWPEGANKRSHKELRDRLKVAALATLYGQTAPSLAVRLGLERHAAQYLLDVHARAYARFWEFQRRYVRGCLATGCAWTTLRWPMHVHATTRITSLMNWPMQATGAEMMRLAMIMLVAAGVRVCCPVHDAFLCEAPEAEADIAVALIKHIMADASARLLGVPCRVDARVIRAGEHYQDERGTEMWERVMRALVAAERAEAA